MLMLWEMAPAMLKVSILSSSRWLGKMCIWGYKCLKGDLPVVSVGETGGAPGDTEAEVLDWT